MFCPHCGAENPDFMWQCGSCGRSLLRSAGPVTAPTTEGSQPIPGPEPGFEGVPRGNPRRLPTFRLDAAIIAVAIGAMLTVLGFALNVYYYERILSPDRDFNEIMDLFDIAVYSMYARFTGVVVALVGAILVIQAMMTAGLASASAALRQIPLRNLLLLLVVITSLLALMTMVMVYVYEAEPDLSESSARLVSRITIYLPQTAVVLGVFGLLFVTMFLRNASLGRGRAVFAEPPR
ncbi:TPA: zinc ribbon domain-containing protein [Thermoplasmata archaeon]|nr:zinc ribbon domain-containing protein [Thermoplasmata archaeon]